LPARERSLIECLNPLFLPDALSTTPPAYAANPSHAKLLLQVANEGNESRLSRFSKILSIAVGTLEAQTVAEDC
jgi:hypothetical protein